MELTGRRYGRRDWRNFLSTRRGTVVVATLCALIAGGIIVYALKKYRSTVNAKGVPETVFVVSRAIPKNTPGEVIAAGNMFGVKQYPAKQVAAGAISDASLLHGKVTVREIYPGEELTAGDFTSNGGLPAQLAPPERAMTLTLDDEHGMLGLLKNGDHVDVYAGATITGQSGQSYPILRLLIPNVAVLKAGSNNSNGPGLSAGSNQDGQVTLKVPEGSAGALAYAADFGKVWLVLRPANATYTRPPSAITIQSLLFGLKAIPVPASNGGTK